MTHDNSFHAAPSLWHSWKRFRPHLAGQGRHLLFAGLLLSVSAVGQIVSVFVLADVVDGTLAAKGISEFVRLALLWIGVTIVSAVADYAGQVISVAASERIVLRMRDNLFRHVQTLSPSATRQFGPGDLIVRHTSDLDAVEHLLGSGLMQLSIALVTTIGLVVTALIMSWPMAVVALAAVPVLWCISALFGRRQESATIAERSAISSIAHAVGSAIAGHESAAAYNQQPRERDRLHSHGLRWLTARMAQTRIEAGFGSVLGCAEVVMTLAIAVTGVWQVRQGALTIGQLIALTGYLGLLYPRMQEISELRLSVASAVVSAGRLIQVLDHPATDVDPVAAVDLSDGPGRVRVRDVTVRRGDRTVLDGVTLDLVPGTMTALTGPSGAGKSTLAGVLAGFDHPDAGRIWCDGIDIARVTRKSLRERVTLLPQAPTISAMTVAEAIAYGRPDAPRDQIVAAARSACADRFIRELPDGYDTFLDDDMPLSGGQVQRLAIARVLLRDSPVLVLDEPTTGLDPATAGEVMAQIRRRPGATLVITHDPQIAALADTVVRLVGGHLVRGVDQVPHPFVERSGAPYQKHRAGGSIGYGQVYDIGVR